MLVFPCAEKVKRDTIGKMKRRPQRVAGGRTLIKRVYLKR
jgi:hypothetical protein